MRLLSNRLIVLGVLVAASVSAPAARAEQSPFVGSWNLTGTGDDSALVYWLEITDSGGTLTGRFLDRVGSPFDLLVVKVEGGELIFQRGRQGNPFGPEYRGRLEGGRMVGHHTLSTGGRRGAPAVDRVVNWVGTKRPEFPASDANAPQKYGTPVVLFDGTTMEAFAVQHPERPRFWGVIDGLLANVPPANNLVSKQKFFDFKIEMEYRLATGSNSGLYLRGRYELQLLDDVGEPVSVLGHAAIYGRIAPSVNASRRAGQWQELSAVVVGDRVTVMLNGQKVQDNSPLGGITGGALDNAELTPGPIMIQGDHSQVAVRKVVVTPIVR